MNDLNEWWDRMKDEDDAKGKKKKNIQRRENGDGRENRERGNYWQFLFYFYDLIY